MGRYTPPNVPGGIRSQRIWGNFAANIVRFRPYLVVVMLYSNNAEAGRIFI